MSFIYWLKNFQTSKVIQVLDDGTNKVEKTLRQRNDEGFNVYRSLNTFYSIKRTKNNLFEFRQILIDIDHNKDYNSIKGVIDEIHTEFGFYPALISETFKGYHLVYSLHKSLYHIDEGSYNALVTFFLNKYGTVGMDDQAKQVTGLYKVPGFIDHRDKRDFKIKELYHGRKGVIKDVETIVKPTFRKNMEKIISGISKRNNNATKVTKSVNAIRFSEIKRALADDGKNLNFVKVGNNRHLEGTDGIVWCMDGDYINDFTHGKNSGENRANGNYNFLKNHIFKNNQQALYSFIHKHFGIRNAKSDECSIGSGIHSALMYGGYCDDKGKGASNNLLKTIYILYSCITADDVSMKTVSIDGIKEKIYEFDSGEMMKRMGVIYHTKNRAKLWSILEEISLLRRKTSKRAIDPFTRESTILTGEEKLFDLWLRKSGKAMKIYIRLAKQNAGTKTSYFSKKILDLEKGYGDGNLIKAAMLIDMTIRKNKVAHYTVSAITKILGVSFKDRRPEKQYIRDLLSKLKQIGIIKEFFMEKGKQEICIY